MFRTLLASAFLFMLATTASAATVDLTDELFVPGSVTYSSAGPINGFQEQVDGVTFTFATGGQFRNVGAWSTIIDPANAALTFGGGSGNTASFTMMVSADILLTSFLGFAQQFNTGAIFDVTGLGVLSQGNSFATEGFLGSATPGINSFIGGPLQLLAGQLYTFSTTNSGFVTQSHMTGLEFSKIVAPIPLPAGLPLLLVGLGGLALITRRKT